jgi:hypothetical protein
MIATRTARQAVAAARALVTTDRSGALEALNDIFRTGHAPSPGLDGRYQGTLITPSLFPMLDGFGRWLTARWLPWKGKTFDRVAQTGDNMFTNDGLIPGRIVFPFYGRYVADGPGRSRALEFRTYYGPGGDDPDLTVLKIDYDIDRNPSYIVRDVLDELVQVDDGYYLGKALLRWGAKWVCAAYFTLEA